jgi:hypothetical protein
MKKIFVTMLILSLATFALAQEETEEQFVGISNYSQLIFLTDSSTADITIEITLEGLQVAELLLPLNYNGKIENFSYQAGTAQIEIITQGSINYARLTTEGELPETIKLAFTAPQYFSWDEAGPKDFGNFEVEFDFVNSSLYPIKAVAGEVVLTEGYVVHNIVSSFPKVSKNDANTPYRVQKHNDKHSLSMTGKDLGFGQRVTVKINIRKESKSIIIAIVALLASILYLIFFRDVLHTKVNGG